MNLRREEGRLLPVEKKTPETGYIHVRVSRRSVRGRLREGATKN